MQLAINFDALRIRTSWKTAYACDNHVRKWECRARIPTIFQQGISKGYATHKHKLLHLPKQRPYRLHEHLYQLPVFGHYLACAVHALYHGYRLVVGGGQPVGERHFYDIRACLHIRDSGDVAHHAAQHTEAQIGITVQPHIHRLPSLHLAEVGGT